MTAYVGLTNINLEEVQHPTQSPQGTSPGLAPFMVPIKLFTQSENSLVSFTNCFVLKFKFYAQLRSKELYPTLTLIVFKNYDQKAY